VAVAVADCDNIVADADSDGCIERDPVSVLECDLYTVVDFVFEYDSIIDFDLEFDLSMLLVIDCDTYGDDVLVDEGEHFADCVDVLDWDIFEFDLDSECDLFKVLVRECVLFIDLVNE